MRAGFVIHSSNRSIMRQKKSLEFVSFVGDFCNGKTLAKREKKTATCQGGALRLSMFQCQIGGQKGTRTRFSYVCCHISMLGLSCTYTRSAGINGRKNTKLQQDTNSIHFGWRASTLNWARSVLPLPQCTFIIIWALKKIELTNESLTGHGNHGTQPTERQYGPNTTNE